MIMMTTKNSKILPSYRDSSYRNDTMSLVLNDYGYLTADGLWRYHIKDWQGNVRAVIDDQGSLLEINNYYPYGMVMEKGNEIATDAQPYKYGGKELDHAIDLPRRVQYKDGHIVYYTYTADGVKLKASYAFDPLNAVVDPIIGPIDGPIEGPITPINAGAPIVEPQDNPDHPVVDPGIVPETERVQSWRDYCGDHIYLNGSLERVLTPVGYIDSLGVHHAFVKDYRGNVRADVTEWEGVVERSDYYPYGMQMQVPWTTMRLQPYKFMGKELDRENGWDSYDVHARWLTSPIAQWTTQDPLAEKYYSWSPYSYCQGDPINRVDRNGKDTWLVDAFGNITGHFKNKNADTFRVVNDNGEYVASMSMKYGSVEHSSTQKTKSGVPYDVYKVRGDNNSKRLFEFMADNTKVEWSQMKLGKKGSGPSFITTSHSADSEAGSPDLFYRQIRYGYTYREDNHNHPGRTARPSGLQNGNIMSCEGDISYARDVMINHDYWYTRFNVYISNLGYIPYDAFSVESDFNDYNEYNINLDEVLIYGNGNKSH